ncbi:MAG: hypothetical protein ACK4YP_21245 [Myxococcota bacterium]
MRDALWYAPISLALAAFAGAGVVAVMLVVDRRYFEPRDVAIVAGVAGVALLVELVGVAGLAAWLARAPRPGAADIVLADTYGGIGTHLLVFTLATFGALLPGLLAGLGLRGEVGVGGALVGLVGAGLLAGLAGWFGTSGSMVWVARDEGRVVARQGLLIEARVPLADVVGVEVRRWQQGARLWQSAALRLREGSDPATISLGLPSGYDTVAREADRVAAATGLPRLPDADGRVAPAR